MSLIPLWIGAAHLLTCIVTDSSELCFLRPSWHAALARWPLAASRASANRLWIHELSDGPEPRALKLLFLQKKGSCCPSGNEFLLWYRTMIKKQLLSSLPFTGWEDLGSGKWNALPRCPRLINGRAGCQTRLRTPPSCQRVSQVAFPQLQAHQGFLMAFLKI